jgi:hypothetical protein
MEKLRAPVVADRAFRDLTVSFCEVGGKRNRRGDGTLVLGEGGFPFWEVRCASFGAPRTACGSKERRFAPFITENLAVVAPR